MTHSTAKANDTAPRGAQDTQGNQKGRQQMDNHPFIRPEHAGAMDASVFIQAWNKSVAAMCSTTPLAESDLPRFTVWRIVALIKSLNHPLLKPFIHRKRDSFDMKGNVLFAAAECRLTPQSEFDAKQLARLLRKYDVETIGGLQ